MSRLEIAGLFFQGRGPYDLTIAVGECVGLSGASGAGKSLFLRAIADLDPHEGVICLGSMNCAEVAAPLWRRSVGMLPAESFWWYDHVGEHFTDFNTIAEESLALLGFDHSVQGWQVSRLSTGEKQRLAILRLLQNRPGALLLDEPTASLDAENIGKAEKLLMNYCRETAIPVLWVSHDPEQLLRVADRRLFMAADGNLLTKGGQKNGR
ncbi:MAG: ATP-binding cassette domain-containing protein [Desulfobulbaceae bacterium]|nr:ATP-binding cassette domain-containing protein [Desulfobulbaceae bacterium]